MFALLGLLGWAVAPVSAVAQTSLAIATAGADLPLAKGVDVLFANPALLAVGIQRGTQIRLLGAAGGIHSNALGWADYVRYNGATLDEQDKSDILDRIPGNGQSIAAEAGIGALAVRHGTWGVAVTGFGSARGLIDREAVDLLLHGNAARPDWDFDELDGEGLAIARAALSYGRCLGMVAGGPLSGGITLAYLEGIYYGHTETAHADLSTDFGGLNGTATTDLITARGGSGCAVDVGAAWQPTPSLVAAVTLANLIHTINWTRDVERTHYELEFVDLTVDNFADSLWVADETTESQPAFRRGLPPQLTLGLGRVSGTIRWSLTGSVAFADRLTASTKPQVAGAVEYAPSAAFPLRAGIALGGAAGFAVGCGTGVHLGPLAWDFALGIDRSLWLGSARGVSGAVTMDLSL